jgi:hypothetical protein
MKLLRVLSPKDLGEINEFLGELKDGDLYKKRLAALEGQKAEINALIEVYGKANDIDRIVSNKLRDEAQAKKSMEAALADREKAKEEAEATKGASERHAAKRIREANEHFSGRERIVKEGEESLDQREKALARALDGLSVRETQVLEESKRSVAIRTKYREAVASLQKAIETTAKAL